MQVDIITKKQMKEEVKKQVESREFKMQREIDLIHKRMLRLEEELKVKRK